MMNRIVSILLGVFLGTSVMAADGVLLGGSTTGVVSFWAVQSADHIAPFTGGDTFTVYYTVDGGSATAMTTPTVAEVSSTNMPGWYRLSVDEAAMTVVPSGLDAAILNLHISHAGMDPMAIQVEVREPLCTISQVQSGLATAAAVPTANQNAVAVVDLSLSGHTTAGSVGAAMSAASAVPTANQNAVAVVDLSLTGHTTAGSVGAAISAAGTGSDPWALTASGYTEGTFGYTIQNVMTESELDTTLSANTDIVAMKATTDKLDAMVQLDGTDYEFKSTAMEEAVVASVTGNIGGNVVGSVGSVTSAVTVGTNNDKTGYSLAADQAVNVTKIAGTTVSTSTAQIGVNVVNWKGSAAAAMTGDAYARLGAPAGASVSADVAAVKSDTAAVLVDTAAMDTSTELRTLLTGSDTALATAAALDVVDNYVDTEIASILEDTGTTLDGRIPAALVGGRMDASVGSMSSGVLTSTAIAGDAITAAKLATDVTTEIQTGLATAAELTKVPKSDGTATWNATALASINNEVDTALNTAIPGSPTADSINERIVAIDAYGTPPSAASIKTALEADGSKLDHLWEMTEDDGGTRHYTANSLENAPTGSGGFTAGDRSTLEGILADTSMDGVVVAAGSKTGYSLAADQAVNVTKIAGTTVSASSAQIGVNVVNWKGSAAPAMTGDAYARLGAPAGGVSISDDLATVKTVADSILEDTGTTLDQRIPAALVSGRMNASVGAMASNVLTASAINADAITASKVAADVTTEIQTGLATAANQTTILGSIPTTSEIKTALEADGSKLDHLWEMTEDDSGGRRFLISALEASPTGSGGFTDEDRTKLEQILTDTNTEGVVVAAGSKTGYTLAGTQAFNMTGNITGNVSGSVGSVTNIVTANTTQIEGVDATNQLTAFGGNINKQDVRDAMALALTNGTVIDGESIDGKVDAFSAGAGTATVEKQNEIISHLEGIKGPTWAASDSLEGIHDDAFSLDTVVDGTETVEDVFECLLAYLTGKVTVVPSGSTSTITFFKRDGTTTKMVITTSNVNGSRTTTGTVN